MSCTRKEQYSKRKSKHKTRHTVRARSLRVLAAIVVRVSKAKQCFCLCVFNFIFSTPLAIVIMTTFVHNFETTSQDTQKAYKW
jgi:hypothetical protein